MTRQPRRRLAATTATAAFILAAGPLGAEEVVYTNFVPSTHYDIAFVMQRFADRIAEATGGVQTVSLSGGGVLASAANTLEAIGTGVVDAGNVIYNYTPSLAPALTLVGDLPGTILQVSAAAVTETYLLDCPECQEEMERIGVQVLANTSTEPFSFVCANRPIRTVDDVRGAQVRATGGLARLMGELGATPVNITFAEIYEGLQRGQLDCTAVGAASLRGIQLWDVADSITTNLPLGTVHAYGLLTVNRDLWRSFTPEQRRIWLDNSAGILADGGQVTLQDSASALQVATSEHGVAAVEADAALQAAVQAALDNQTAAAIETARGRGVRDPEAIAAAYAENVAKWTAIYQEIGEGEWSEAQWAQFQQRLRTEIYDQVSAD